MVETNFISQNIAHITEAVTEAGASFPVFGNALTASLMLVSAIIAIAFLYFLINRLPKSRSARLSFVSEVRLAEAVATFVVFAIASAAWDIWWHRAVGRDSLFVPPHISLYIFAGLAITLSVYGWFRTREKTWKHIAVALFMVPVTVPFDNLWHVINGIEDLSHPISLAWSPPHVLLDLAAMAALLLLIPIFKRAGSDRRTFFIDVIFASVLSLVSFLIMPFHPTDGWGQVIGFYGAGVLAFVYVFVVHGAQMTVRGSFDAVRVTTYYLLFIFLTYGKETAPQVILQPHDRPPLWVYIASFLVAAVILDIGKERFPRIALGAIAGGAQAALLFCVSPLFFSANFTYGQGVAWVAVGAAVLGGALAMFFSGIFFKK